MSYPNKFLYGFLVICLLISSITVNGDDEFARSYSYGRFGTSDSPGDRPYQPPKQKRMPQHLQDIERIEYEQLYNTGPYSETNMDNPLMYKFGPSQRRLPRHLTDISNPEYENPNNRQIMLHRDPLSLSNYQKFGPNQKRVPHYLKDRAKIEYERRNNIQPKFKPNGNYVSNGKYAIASVPMPQRNNFRTIYQKNPTKISPQSIASRKMGTLPKQELSASSLYSWLQFICSAIGFVLFMFLLSV